MPTRKHRLEFTPFITATLTVPKGTVTLIFKDASFEREQERSRRSTLKYPSKTFCMKVTGTIMWSQNHTKELCRLPIERNFYISAIRYSKDLKKSQITQNLSEDVSKHFRALIDKKNDDIILLFQGVPLAKITGTMMSEILPQK